MHSRVVRVMLVALLLAVGIGAALQLDVLLRQARQLDDDRRALITDVGRFDALAADLATTQAAYAVPGQSDTGLAARSSALQSQLTTTLADIQRLAQSANAAAAVATISDALMELAAADSRAQAYLQQQDPLLVAAVVFGDARSAVDAARGAAVELAAAERARFDRDRGAIDDRLLLIAGSAAAVWVIGVLVLMPRAGRRRETDTATPPLSRLASDPAPPARASDPAAAPAVDLAEAAALCAALSRVDSAAAIPDMLARAAALLDATGVIVWMGAGEELFAVASHGYHPHVINRLGSIPRTADNATAESWRTGELRTVPGDPMSNGAIVAPMFSPDGCIGVFAAEVRHGREHDPATHAVTAMVASQLATVVAAWPSAPHVRTADA